MRLTVGSDVSASPHALWDRLKPAIPSNAGAALSSNSRRESCPRATVTLHLIVILPLVLGIQLRNPTDWDIAGFARANVPA